MLRDLPPFQPQPDVEVLMNAPGVEDEPVQQPTSYIDPFGDVFGSAPSSPVLNVRDTHNEDQSDIALPTRPPDHPSDVSRLRSIHVTNGYREGIAASKEKHIQEGFDEGYSLGAEIALKAGSIIGSLEGLFHALPNSAPTASLEVGNSRAENGVTRHMMAETVREAERHLAVERLIDREYFGEDGVWVYNVPGQDSEGNVTFAEVAEAHPIIKMWNKRLRELCTQLGVVLETAKDI